MGRHIVGTFGCMDKQRVSVGNQSSHEGLEITPHVGIGVFAEDQRSAGVMDEDVTEALVHSRADDQILNLPGDFVAAPASGRDLTGVLFDHANRVRRGSSGIVTSGMDLRQEDDGRER